MATYFSSDLHVGHGNIIRYSGRPYLSAASVRDDDPRFVDAADVAAMNADLVRRWNSVVGPRDDAWVLGDAAMGRIAESLPVVGQLNGVLRLVPGNHDRCWVGQRKGVERWRGEYLAAGFAEIVDDPEPLAVAGRRVLLHHFPYVGDSHDEDRYARFRPVDRGEWLFCGHVHEKWRQRGRQVNVGLDAWGGYPVALDELAALVEAGPADRDPLRWEATAAT